MPKITAPVKDQTQMPQSAAAAEAAVGQTWDDLYNEYRKARDERMRNSGFPPFFELSKLKKGDVVVLNINADEKPRVKPDTGKFAKEGVNRVWIRVFDEEGTEYTLSVRSNSKAFEAIAEALAGKRGTRKLQITRVGEGVETEYIVKDLTK